MLYTLKANELKEKNKIQKKKKSKSKEEKDDDDEDDGIPTVPSIGFTVEMVEYHGAKVTFYPVRYTIINYSKVLCIMIDYNCIWILYVW